METVQTKTKVEKLVQVAFPRKFYISGHLLGVGCKTMHSSGLVSTQNCPSLGHPLSTAGILIWNDCTGSIDLSFSG